MQSVATALLVTAAQAWSLADYARHVGGEHYHNTHAYQNMDYVDDDTHETYGPQYEADKYSTTVYDPRGYYRTEITQHEYTYTHEHSSDEDDSSHAGTETDSSSETSDDHALTHHHEEGYNGPDTTDDGSHVGEPNHLGDCNESDSSCFDSDSSDDAHEHTATY